MKEVVLVTGASSGFGLLTAQALARAGHTVYASMRESTGRNAPRVAAIATYAQDTASTCTRSSSTSATMPRSTPPSTA